MKYDKQLLSSTYFIKCMYMLINHQTVHEINYLNQLLQIYIYINFFIIYHY